MRKVRYLVSCRRKVFLIDRLIAAGILAEEIEEGDGLAFSVAYSQSRIVDATLDRYGFKYQKSGYRGMRALLISLLSRPFLLLSTLIAIVLVMISQSFVYGYSVKGNHFVNTARVEEVLREAGAAGIVYKKNIDAAALKRAVGAIEGVSFADVKTEGSRLVVEIKEELPREEPDTLLYQGVTSLYSAVVTRIVAESGTPVVRSGDRVRAGDLLISPTYAFTEGEAPAPARGEVWGLMTYEKEVILPLYTVETVRTGEIFRTKTLTMFGKKAGKESLPPFTQYDLEERVVYRGVAVTVTEKVYHRREPITLCHDLDAEAPALLRQATAELLLSVDVGARERGAMRRVQKKVDNVLYIVLYYTVEQRIDSQIAR